MSLGPRSVRGVSPRVAAVVEETATVGVGWGVVWPESQVEVFDGSVSRFVVCMLDSPCGLRGVLLHSSRI